MVPLKLAALGAQWSVKKYAGEDSDGVETDRLLGQSDCAKARRFIRAAKMTAAKGVACWCPNPACDEVIDLLSAMPICKVCACEVCKSCYQKKHAGPCAVAADSSSLKLCRDNFQKCPRCKAVVEKKMACDHMRCRCGQTFARLRRARPRLSHGVQAAARLRPERGAAPGERRAGARLGQRRRRLLEPRVATSAMLDRCVFRRDRTPEMGTGAGAISSSSSSSSPSSSSSSSNHQSYLDTRRTPSFA